MSTKGKSTAKISIEAVQNFNSWVEEKVREGTLDRYVRRGMLNRSEIALECGFSRSLFSSNDPLKAALARVENEFMKSGYIEKRSDGGERQVDPSALESKLASKERELNSLRERLANKTAENEELKRKLASSNAILDDIIPTGRRVKL
ncbi:hypothetical protein [Thioclava sp. F28-4]|uniref:hypothetical protein n=1 Tax=Thioclava sp. F28-4 TaxID=1915315 RepID=UPI000996C329|nr:hypothetical protein [Thioclava sp. F28-4]OOY05219.1 hypothetical protein BMI87_09425 [Thioclava sp. F28-4]